MEDFIRSFHLDNSAFFVLNPVGNVLPISQVRSEVATAFRKEVDWQTNQMLLPFKKMCEQRKVRSCCSWRLIRIN